MMLITGLILIFLGVALGVIGWLLNMNTPIQQPLPVVGFVIVVIGVFVWLMS